VKSASLEKRVRNSLEEKEIELAQPHPRSFTKRGGKGLIPNELTFLSGPKRRQTIAAEGLTLERKEGEIEIGRQEDATVDVDES